MMPLWVSPTMSCSTMGSSVYASRPLCDPSAAALNTAFTSATVTSRLSSTTTSLMLPTGVGTRRLVPSNLPFSLGYTWLTALAAPVLVGMMLMAAARARRRSLCGRSSTR